MKSAIYKAAILFVLQYNYIIKATQTMDSIEFSHKSMGTCAYVSGMHRRKDILTTA